MQQEFKVGERVFHIQSGWGTVTTTQHNTGYPILVGFENGYIFSYTKDGKIHSSDLFPSLSHTEYSINSNYQERVIEVSNDGVNWIKRILIKFIDNRPIAWNDAGTIESAKDSISCTP